MRPLGVNHPRGPFIITFSPNISQVTKSASSSRTRLPEKSSRRKKNSLNKQKFSLKPAMAAETFEGFWGKHDDDQNDTPPLANLVAK